MNIARYLNPLTVLQQKSCFLFGPRQTGKSMLIRQCLKDYKAYNLLDRDVYLRLSRNPSLIRQALTDSDRLIIIDEIQLMPDLLNEVHLMIEEHGVKFLLTGSSPRSLKKKANNLLGGRARSRQLHPFTRSELGIHFKLETAIHNGLIPSHYFSDAVDEDLAAYAGDYLKEEITAEAAVRNIQAFSRFLEVAAHCHGSMINFTQIANDSQVPTSTVREYFQILVDTLIAYPVSSYTETRKRKAISTAKFYFFDYGLVRYLQSRGRVIPKTPEYGIAFESYIFHELNSYCSYHLIQPPKYWRSTSQYEVDFIYDDRVAIEVKAKDNISKKELKGLKALQEEKLMETYYMVCMEPERRVVDAIVIIPWQEFLDKLWGDGF